VCGTVDDGCGGSLDCGPCDCPNEPQLVFEESSRNESGEISRGGGPRIGLTSQGDDVYFYADQDDLRDNDEWDYQSFVLRFADAGAASIRVLDASHRLFANTWPFYGGVGVVVPRGYCDGGGECQPVFRTKDASSAPVVIPGMSFRATAWALDDDYVYVWPSSLRAPGHRWDPRTGVLDEGHVAAGTGSYLSPEAIRAHAGNLYRIVQVSDTEDALRVSVGGADYVDMIRIPRQPPHPLRSSNFIHLWFASDTSPVRAGRIYFVTGIWDPGSASPVGYELRSLPVTARGGTLSDTTRVSATDGWPMAWNDEHVVVSIDTSGRSATMGPGARIDVVRLADGVTRTVWRSQSVPGGTGVGSDGSFTVGTAALARGCVFYAETVRSSVGNPPPGTHRIWRVQP
jgi:hypothetical protein